MNQLEKRLRRDPHLVERGGEFPRAQMTGGETLMGGEARFFERMGERIMADVVKQRGELDLRLLGDTAGKMVCTQRVLKPRVRGARINEKCVTELPDVPQTLEGRRIDDRERLGLEADIVPERVANYFKRARRIAQNSF